MKKITVLKTMLAALVVPFMLTACGGEAVTKIKSFTVKPSEITLAPGETARLATLIEPEGITPAPTITWTSSNEEVVTVSDNGTITAQALGSANITATTGEFTSVCAVTVKEYLETLAFTGAFVYYYDTTYSYKLDTLRSESWGDQYYVAKKVLCDFLAFSEGFYIDEEGEFAGASKGAVIEFQAPFYWAPKWANNGSGTIFVLGDWAISNEYPDSTTTVGRPYSINEEAYTAAVNDFVQHYFVEGDDSQVATDLKAAADQIKGATLRTYEFHSQEEGYPSDGYFSSYIPDMVIGEGWMTLGDNYAASKYMCSIEAYDLNGKELKYEQDELTNDIYIYGARFQETEEAVNLMDNIVYFSNEYYYQAGQKASAPHKVAARKASELRPIPVREFSAEQVARIREQLNRTAPAKK